MKPADTLRTLEMISQADPHGDNRQTLADHRRQLNTIRVDASVPHDVVRLVGTAKNLSLYAYFVRDFHPVARLVGFIALEAALKKKWLARYGKPPEATQQCLKSLLAHAVENGRIRSESFVWVRSTAEYNAKARALNALYEKSPTGGFDPPLIGDISIQREISALAPWVEYWAEAARESRNTLAHGELWPHDKSEGPLHLIVDAINGMFAR